MKPERVNILGKNYKILYFDKPSDVDIHKREACWGQIDYWTRTIRLYSNEMIDEDIFHNLLHEIIHGIESELNLKCFEEKQGHDELDVLALALADVLIRNNWVKL